MVGRRRRQRPRTASPDRRATSTSEYSKKDTAVSGNRRESSVSPSRVPVHARKGGFEGKFLSWQAGKGKNGTERRKLLRVLPVVRL